MAGRLYATDTGETFEKQGYTEEYTPDTGLREPDVISYDENSTNLTQLSSILGTTGYDTMENFNRSLQQEYNDVVKSVYENQGFYIGRYETSGMNNSDENATVKSVAGTNTGISSVTWYRMYAQQKKYAENNQLTSVKSTMIQGAAYDQVMKFVENGERPDSNTYTIKTAGNVGHDRVYSDEPWQTGGLNYSSSTPYNDKVKNIYDLEGNVYTWTTEAYFTDDRVFRGRSLDDCGYMLHDYFLHHRIAFGGGMAAVHFAVHPFFAEKAFSVDEIHLIPRRQRFFVGFADDLQPFGRVGIPIIIRF